MGRFDPLEELGRLVEEEQDRIVRLWSKRLMRELREADIGAADLRQPLEGQVRELGRLLRDRGEEGIRLWAEGIRGHGTRRYDQRFEASDLVRELKALGQVLLRVYGKRRGQVQPEIAELVSELIGEGSASILDSYTRVVRTEEVRFREAAVMETILQHVDVGILLAERDGTISFATPAVSRLTGLPVRALVGGRATQTLDGLLTQLDARHLDGSRFKAADLPFARALKLGGALQGEWMIIHRPGGEEVVLEMGAVPVWEDGPGSPLVGAIQTIVDRTESAQKNRQLSQAYEELKLLQGRLLQKTRAQALAQLAGGAAHALNNFLNVLRLRVTLLRKDFRPEHLDALDRAVGNVGQLVARLQDFSAQRGEEEPTEVSFEQAVAEAVGYARPELERPERNIQLEVLVPTRSRVLLDPALLRELVVNLLLTLADRMPSGGTLRIGTVQRQGTIELRVSGGGEPFNEEQLAMLFDPLKGAAVSPQRSLLLAVGRSQVQRWGGELNFERRPDGAEFRVRLPVVVITPEVAAPAPAAVAHFEPAGKTRRVLVVDDDPDNAMMMAEVLVEEGYQAKVANSGQEALKLWDSEPFDAALLDALMPGMSGWELARELRARSPDVLLAMVTGAELRGMNRANLALVDSVFRKPVDIGALDEFLSGERRRPEEQPQGEHV